MKYDTLTHDQQAEMLRRQLACLREVDPANTADLTDLQIIGICQRANESACALGLTTEDGYALWARFSVMSGEGSLTNEAVLDAVRDTGDPDAAVKAILDEL